MLRGIIYLAKLLESASIAAVRWLRGIWESLAPPARPGGLRVAYARTEFAYSASSSGVLLLMATNVYDVTFDPPADPATVASRELSYQSGADPATITTLAVGDPAPQLRVPHGLTYTVGLTDLSPAGVRSATATVTGTASEGGDLTPPATPTGLAVTFVTQEP